MLLVVPPLLADSLLLFLALPNVARLATSRVAAKKRATVAEAAAATSTLDDDVIIEFNFPCRFIVPLLLDNVCVMMLFFVCVVYMRNRIYLVCT